MIYCMRYLYTIAITKGKLAVVGPIIHNLLNANFKSKKNCENPVSNFTVTDCLELNSYDLDV